MKIVCRFGDVARWWLQRWKLSHDVGFIASLRRSPSEKIMLSCRKVRRRQKAILSIGECSNVPDTLPRHGPSDMLQSKFAKVFLLRTLRMCMICQWYVILTARRSFDADAGLGGDTKR